MKSSPVSLHSVWQDSRDIITKKDTALDLSQLNESVAAIFCPGPFCYFVIDFYDMSIVSSSANLRDLVDVQGEITLNSIIATIHPDDMQFVAIAEKACIDYLYKKIGNNKQQKYKLNYCFRAKHPDGSYRMLSRQGIILTVDDNGGFAKCLNIFTDISHLTVTNSYKISMIGINEPSFLNIDIGYSNSSASQKLTSRELDILKLIAEGLGTKEIAERLNVSVHTISTHRKNILTKSNARSITNLVSRCIQEGII